MFPIEKKPECDYKKGEEKTDLSKKDSSLLTRQSPNKFMHPFVPLS
jgi:hypothetical protein